ncbi:MAG TPA: ChuX/HutX family heme-like substrate-binding protein [Gemmataceae bacterium]|jgi:putative hemin transport protein
METRERIQAAIRANPNQMTMLLARKFGVPEVEIIRAFPDDRAVELDAQRWEELIRSLEAFGNVHVIVSNGAVTLEANGQFGGFSTTGEFFNVQTQSLDMHIRWREIGAAFAVEKPGHLDGNKTFSFQFFDRCGHSALKAFLSFGSSVPPEKVERFVHVRDSFRKK